MVIGTVKGDIHDIGKNLVSMMMEGAGFEVIDLGINNAVDKYLDALEQHKPDILGMSALLTTTMPYMKVVIDTLKEKGLRDDYIVLVGGAPLNEEFGQAIGADAYCRDAAVAVETAKAFVASGTTARRPRRAPERPQAMRPRHRPDTAEDAADRLRGARPRGAGADRDQRLAALELTCLPAQAAQPAREDSGGGARQDPGRARGSTSGSSCSTATAAPAACSTKCSPRRESSASRARIATPSTRARPVPGRAPTPSPAAST